MGSVNVDKAPAGRRCPVCAQLRMEGSRVIRYAVTPAAGGGWPGWGAALTRLLRKIGQNPTQVLIIEQRPHTARYVQLLVGHGQAHAEASSNVYLPDDYQLCAEEENLLVRIGWRPPERDFDDGEELPANWTLPLIRGDWQGLAELVLATVAGVFRFDEDLPVQVGTFQTDDPCVDCFPQVAS